MIIQKVAGVYIVLVKSTLRYYSGTCRSCLIDKAIKEIYGQ